ncbi:MAG: zinc ribbon domain-containing protein, partial [Chloroflexota bacterium]|nr:zinc ribbon domain-containing protein [Chloroflexota bacterium]
FRLTSTIVIGSKKMPIYEYNCPKCEHEFELRRSFSEADEPAICPECSHKAWRLISMFASFSKDADGVSTPIGGGSSCDSCSSSSCST